ncbi:MAG TPA: adenosine deaminase [Acidobacteriaceae bacterium]
MTKPAIDSSTQLRRIAAGVAILFVCILTVGGILLLPRPNSNRMRVGEHEQRTLLMFDRAAGNPLKLRAFLEEMPKGGDLHMHLSGAIYAETFLQNAIADNLCIDPVTFDVKPSTGLTKSIPAQPVCATGQQPAADALRNQKLYDAAVDAYSMRTFVPKSGTDGHDQFFSTFARFGSLGAKHAGEWVDEVATRAASQNEQYLEIMHTPDFGAAAAAGYAVGWNPNLPAMRNAVLAKGLQAAIAANRAEFDAMDATRNQREHCGTPQALPACNVTVRYIYQVLRGFPPQQVFAQTLLGFEVASVDPRVVGINFVMPEDGYVSMNQYHQQMLMLDYLHSVYPNVHITLHAGELAYEMVPPDGLKFHIREAIELGHAERIGHGVSIMYEHDPQSLLKEMRAKHIMVEINLTSNDVILGVTGDHHPLPIYLAARVPVALSTDDEGVSRIDITHEYERAVTDFGFTYLDLKRSARTSIEHSFLPGADLWAKPDKFTRFVDACSEESSSKCSGFLKGSEKARQQMELERRFHDFELKQSQVVEAYPH